MANRHMSHIQQIKSNKKVIYINIFTIFVSQKAKQNEV